MSAAASRSRSSAKSTRSTCRRVRAVDLVVEAFGKSVFKKSATVLGAAFKPHSDDTRDSPALDVAVRLRGLGAWVTITDPAALENARHLHPQLNYVEDRVEALRGADAVIVVTEWDEYRRDLSPGHDAREGSRREIDLVGTNMWFSVPFRLA